jgi:LuxR family maltose regulon positive regulatory protein
LIPNTIFHGNVPVAPENQLYLDRPRIDRFLEEAMENQVVTVTAGAGYGKTHAVYAFLRKYNVITIWIQLSEWDNIPERFWEHFVASVALISRETADKIIETGFPETERQFDRYVMVPNEDIYRDKKYVFVFDDFHLIHNPEILHFIERSVTAPFFNITSILISRSEPPLNLIRLLSKGLLAKIGEEQLRFTQEEMSAYFRLQGLEPKPPIAAAIYRDTEGWAFAIHLAALSLKKAPPGAGYVAGAMRSNIFKLIEQEIIAAVSPELRKYLIKLSLIDHLTADLLREIAEADSPNLSLLDEMEKIGSFIRFDTYLNAYHIHHLLLEYLCGKQGELSGEERREVYARAAEWCFKNGQKMDAITYYEKAGDYGKLIEVIYTLPQNVSEKTSAFLLEIMEKAPESVYNEYVVAHIVYARFLISLKRFTEARERLWSVIKKYEARPASPSNCRLLSGCYNNLGFLGILTCHITRNYDWVDYYEKAHYYHAQSGFIIRGPITISSPGSFVLMVKDPEKEEADRYIRAVSAAEPHAIASMSGCMAGISALSRSELALYQGDFVQAEVYARESLRKAREYHQYEIENRALFFLLRIDLSRGDVPGIREIIKQLEAQLNQTEYPHRTTYHAIFMGWFYVQTGQPDKLAGWLKNEFEESDLNSLIYGFEVLVKARYLLVKKRYPAAIAALEISENDYDATAYIMGRVEARALKAVCRYYLRDKAGAYAALREAWELAHPNGIILPFIGLGKHMRTLVEAIQKDQTGGKDAAGIPGEWLEQVRLKASAYAKKLFAVTEALAPQERRGIPAGGTPALSRREIDVLKGLSQGLTRDEIAEASDISVNTVKSVIRSVYNKLGALNRADAVRIATTRGIL